MQEVSGAGPAPAASDSDVIARVVGNGPFTVEEVQRTLALAQLGASVLAILGERGCGDGPEYAARTTDEVVAAARALGLLGEEVR